MMIRVPYTLPVQVRTIPLTTIHKILIEGHCCVALHIQRNLFSIRILFTLLHFVTVKHLIIFCKM